VYSPSSVIQDSVTSQPGVGSNSGYNTINLLLRNSD
jgi:hypothetical protein